MLPLHPRTCLCKILSRKLIITNLRNQNEDTLSESANRLRDFTGPKKIRWRLFKRLRLVSVSTLHYNVSGSFLSFVSKGGIVISHACLYTLRMRSSEDSPCACDSMLNKVCWVLLVRVPVSVLSIVRLQETPVHCSKQFLVCKCSFVRSK